MARNWTRRPRTDPHPSHEGRGGAKLQPLRNEEGMAENLEELMVSWELKRDEFEADQKVYSMLVMDECIEDLRSTMRVMEANEVLRQLRKA